MATDTVRFDALGAVLTALQTPDRETLREAIDFLNAYADVGVWDEVTATFTFVDVSRARLLARTLQSRPQEGFAMGEKEDRLWRRLHRR